MRIALFSMLLPFVVMAQTEMETAIDRVLSRAVQAGATPGMSVAVVKRDRPVYVKGFGVTDMDSRRPVTPQTPFYIASTTKSFTALAAIVGASEDTWDLDAPITRYLNDLPDSVEWAGLTMRDLINHTHGFTGDDALTFRTAFSGEIDNDGMHHAMQALRSKGRSPFDYSNTGYLLAGRIIEYVTGASWKDYVSRRVLEPAGMFSTRSSMMGVDPSHIAQPHVIDTVGFVKLRYTKSDVTMHAAGGHISTSSDLARWLLIHLNGGRLDGKQVIPEKAVVESHRIQVEQKRKFGPIERFGWSPGWDIGLLNGDTLYHRFGSFPGFRSHVSFMPGRGLGVAVLVNEAVTGSRLADMVASYLYAMYDGRHELADDMERELQSVPSMINFVRGKIIEDYARRAQRQAPLPYPLSAYTGSFKNETMGTLHVRSDGERPVFQTGVLIDEPEIYDAAKLKWRVDWAGGGEVLTFVFSDGRAVAIEYQGLTFLRE